VKPRKVIRVVY